MRRTNVLVLLVLAILAGLMIWTSMRTPRVECEVCLTFDGRPNCASASAPSREEAVRAATDVACATLAGGRAASLQCSRSEPDRVSCP